MFKGPKSEKGNATLSKVCCCFDVAVDEVTAGAEHHGVAMAALIMPNSLSMGGRQQTGK